MDSNARIARVVGLLTVILSFTHFQPAFALRVLSNPAAAHASADSEASLAGASAATASESGTSGPEAASVMQSGAADPCTLESDVEDLRSVVNGVNNHYVYKDTAVDSPDQTNLPSSVDIVAELTAILQRAERGEYERLMDAHVDTFNAINGLNDGHTMFRSGCFFGMATFFLPLPLFAVVEDGQQIVRVATRQYLERTLTGLSPSLPQVLTIEGQPAVQYIKQWADKHGGMVRNPSARFNMMFAALDPEGRARLSHHAGEFVVRELVPESDTLQVSILRGGAAENVSVPWMAISRPETFTDSHSYWTLNCAKHNESCPGNAARNGSSGSSDSGSGSEEAPPPMFELDVLRMRPQYQQYQWPHRRQQQQPQEKQERKEEAGPPSSDVQSSDNVAQAIVAGGDGAAITMEKVSADDAYYLMSLFVLKRYQEPHSTSQLSFLSPGRTPQPLLTALHHSHVYLLSNRTAVIVLHHGDDQPHPLVSNRTAVIVLHTFSVSRPALNPVAYLAEEILKAMDAARRTNCTEVIFDVRDNGGGLTVLASVTVVALLGTRNVPLADATLPMDFIIGTNFTWSLVEDQAIPRYATNAYTQPSDGASLLSSSQDYTPLQNVSFSAAGRAGTYTADFKLDFGKIYGELAEKPGSAEPFFGARPFLFLADGDCFSTCAILTHMLGKRYKVPMVTVGGFLNQPMSVSALCLGYTMRSLNCDVSVPLSRTTHANDPRASKPFKTNMDVSMAFTNGYVDSTVPCEFEFLPSQRHVDYTVDRIDKPEVIWSDVAKLFPELPLPPVIARTQAAV
ncbi:unnamed protein product [Closterium sp. Naga37s-1]|nr:unnamed protein product [Closterium sp. Naga37s-1]